MEDKLVLVILIRIVRLFVIIIINFLTLAAIYCTVLHICTMYSILVCTYEYKISAIV